MGLVGELLPFLVAFYLLDAFVRVAPGQALFVSLLARPFRLLPPGWRLGGLLPTSESLLAASLGLRANADGVLVASRVREPDGNGASTRATRDPRERLVRYEDMERVQARDGRVRLGPGLLLRPTHPAQVGELAELIEALRRAPPRRRLAVLRRTLRRRCDVVAARQRWLALSGELRGLKLASAAAFIALFVLLPASVMPELPLRPSPPAALLLLALSWGAVLALSARRLRRSGVRGGALGSRLLPLIVFPPAAAHAAAVVVRESLLGYEPLAVAAVLLDAQDFRLLEQRRRRELAGRGQAPGGPGDERTLVEAMTLDGLARQARRAGIPELRPPLRSDGSAAAFCPHCHQQYRSGFDRCHECRVALERFAA